MKRILLLAISQLYLLTVCKAQDILPKPLTELLENQKKGWDVITQWSSNATNKIEILPKDNSRADSALFKSQLFASSPIGAIIYGCGGIFVEDGWIRILGSGCNQFDRSLPDWNMEKSTVKFKDQSAYLLVGDDVIGGMYGMKKEGPDEITIGKIYYYGPNSLQWEATGLSYTGFLNFCFSGNLSNFYGDFRWQDWKEDLKKLNGNQVISFFPLLWTKEGKEIKSNRRIISMQKQWELYLQQTKTETKPCLTKHSPSKKSTLQANKSAAHKPSGK
jgi:hypothetical protein